MESKCHNCEKNAIYLADEADRKIPLCLDCYSKLQNIRRQQTEDYERAMNYLAGQFEQATGLAGILNLPRFPERKPAIHMGEVTLNNISVSQSQIGILNTGTLQDVDTTVTFLNQHQNQELASNLKELVEAVVASVLSAEKKNEVLELINELAEQAAVPKDKRRMSVARALISQIGSALGGIAALASLWHKFQATLEVILNQ